MTKKKEEKKKDQVRIRILPLKGIGGVGRAGDTAWMDREEAEQYKEQGYLEILDDEEEVVEVPSQAASDDEDADDDEEEDAGDHAIMPPENKRQ